MVALTDKELMQRAADGSREAFDELVTRFRDRLVSFAWHLTGDRHAAEDLAQETLLRAYRASRRYDGRAEVSTWVFTIARNLCLNARRDQARRRTVPLPTEGDGMSPSLPDPATDSPAAGLERAELARLIEQAVAALPERQRTALVLAKYEEMPYEQIAQVLDSTVAAVKLCVFRAKGALRAKLAPYLRS